MTSTATERRMLDEMLEAGLRRSSPADERALLGAMMMASASSGIPAEVREKLRSRNRPDSNGAHHFTDEHHKIIWSTILELIDAGEPHDPLQVAARMPAATLQRIGGVPYLHKCLDDCPATVNATAYARDLVGATLLRSLGEVAAVATRQTISSSLHGAKDTLDAVRARLDEIEVPSEGAGPVIWKSTGQAVWEEMDRLSLLAEDPDAGTAEFTTGWLEVDRLLAPVVPGAMIIIAGRPGMAKTTVAANIALHLGMEKRLPVLFFSLEMSRLEIGMKVLCSRAKLRGEDIKHGTLTDEDWEEARQKLAADRDAPFEIDDTPGITIGYIDRELSAFVRRHGRAPVAFFVDHIGLMEEAGGRDVREKTEAVSKALKRLAKKYGTVCIALCQLNRGPENRPGSIPQMSDLRNSGSIEQDADVVALLYRPDYYDKESPRRGEMDFIVAKHRNGPTDTIVLAALLHMSKISCMAI